MSRLLDPLGVALRVTAILDGLNILHTIGGALASSVASAGAVSVAPSTSAVINFCSFMEHSAKDVAST